MVNKRVKIVVLDGFTLNPGDLDWTTLNRLGETTVYERTEPNDIVSRAMNADILLVNKAKLTAEILQQLPSLGYIGLTATGYDNVDIQTAKKKGIAVANVPEYGTSSVAQSVFALLLELCHHLSLHAHAVASGEWSQSPDFCFWRKPIIELQGKTLGIIGLGRIGRKVKQIGLAFGMNVVAADSGEEGEIEEDFKWLSLEELLRTADVVSLHCPLNQSTNGLIDKQRLNMMKKTALLINTSRGPLIHEQDLANALNEDRIAGAGLDVLCVEPPDADHPLLKAKNCLISPHIAWASFEARSRLLDASIENVTAYLAGVPLNRII